MIGLWGMMIGALIGVALIAIEIATRKCVGEGCFAEAWLIMAAVGLLMAAAVLLVLGPLK